MKAVLKKELHQMTHSMIASIYLSVVALIGGCLFLLNNLLAGSGDIRNYFSSIMPVVLFLIPILTMRSYSDEKKSKTETLLISAPVSCFEVAMGKFLAIMTLFSIGLLLSLVYVAILAMFGQFDFLVVLGNIVGMFVTACAFVSIGMFISSLTDSQILACIVSYTIFLGMWLIGNAGRFIKSEEISSIVSSMSISKRFSEFSMGIFDVSTIIYYLSISAFFIFVITLLAESRRQQ